MWLWSIIAKACRSASNLRDDLLGIQAGLDDLQGDTTTHRLVLFGHVDGSHAAFADALQQLVRSDRFSDSVECAGSAGIFGVESSWQVSSGSSLEPIANTRRSPRPARPLPASRSRRGPRSTDLAPIATSPHATVSRRRHIAAPTKLVAPAAAIATPRETAVEVDCLSHQSSFRDYSKTRLLRGRSD